MTPVITGIITSSIHVVTGPDHIAAVTPLAIDSRQKAWAVGVLWGLGHVLGMLLIGVLFILFKEFIPVDAISSYSEQLVGIVLIAIGAWAIIKVMYKNKKHAHVHIHLDKEAIIHDHPHEHPEDKKHAHSHNKPLKQNKITAFSVGTLHGFAGVSHLILILPTLALPSVWDSALYLVGFGLGTIAAMLIFAMILGIISNKTAISHNTKWFNILRVAGGLFAIAIGILWIFSTF